MVYVSGVESRDPLVNVSNNPFTSMQPSDNLTRKCELRLWVPWVKISHKQGLVLTGDLFTRLVRFYSSSFQRFKVSGCFLAVAVEVKKWDGNLKVKHLGKLQLRGCCFLSFLPTWVDESCTSTVTFWVEAFKRDIDILLRIKKLFKDVQLATLISDLN